MQDKTSTPEIEETLIDINELARILNVSVSTLRRWRSQGNVPLPPAVILGGVIRFRRQDVSEHIRKNLEDAA